MHGAGVGLRDIYDGDANFLLLAGVVIEEVARRRREAMESA